MVRLVADRCDRGGGHWPSRRPAADAAAGSPSITVTPAGVVASGDTVHVVGTGFPAKQDVVAVECAKGTTDPGDCDTFNYVLVTTDAKGAFTTTFGVHRMLFLQTGFLDCAPGRARCSTRWPPTSPGRPPRR